MAGADFTAYIEALKAAYPEDGPRVEGDLDGKHRKIWENS